MWVNLSECHMMKLHIYIPRDPVMHVPFMWSCDCWSRDCGANISSTSARTGGIFYLHDFKTENREHFFSQAGQSCIIFCHTYGYSTPSLSNACFTIIFFLTATLFPKVMEAIRTYAKKAKGSFGFFCFYKGCVNSDFAAEIWMSSTNSFTKLWASNQTLRNACIKLNLYIQPSFPNLHIEAQSQL